MTASMKLGSKADAFKRHGQAWFCNTGLPSDIIVEVGEMSFHLHKLPLLSKSSVLETMVGETSEECEEVCVIQLNEIPGGSETFELVSKFCYGVKLEMSATNVVYLRCAAEYLSMTEDYGSGNLIQLSEIFLDQVVLCSWKDSLKALETCENVLPQAEDLDIVQRCIDSLSVKACKDPSLVNWPLQSPGGSVMWNGISTGAKRKNYGSSWWFEDVSCLSLPIYKRLISSLKSQGCRQKIISNSIAYYAKKYLPGLNRRKGIAAITNQLARSPSTVILSEDEQKHVLEEIVSLFPVKKGLVSTKILFGLLRTAMILRVDHSCVSSLEKMAGLQLDQASLDDLLLPNFSYSMETLYNVDSAKRILEHFLAADKEEGGISPCLVEDGNSVGSPSMISMLNVAKLIDGFLAEIASDVSLKMSKFHSFASKVPDYARQIDDGIYRAIDIYLKAHPWLTDLEREKLCRLIDCQKLSLEACTHAAQNERLPLRVVVQVLFFEQLQLKSSISSSYLVSDSLDQLGPRTLESSFMRSNDDDVDVSNQVLKLGMNSMRTRVFELERECSSMRREIERLNKEKTMKWEVKNMYFSRKSWSSVTGRFRFQLKPQMCTTQEDSVSDQTKVSGKKIKKSNARVTIHRVESEYD